MRRAIIFVVAVLAFAIGQAGWATEPQSATIWSQSADLSNGVAYSSELKVPSTVADNWVCPDENLSVSSLSWFGSYWRTYADGDYAPSSASFANANAGGISFFRISIWENAPDTDRVPYDHPAGNSPVWSYDAFVYTETAQAPTTAGRDVYSYTVDIPEPRQFVHHAGSGDETYWVSIVAELTNAVGYTDTTRQWGWLESANSQHQGSTAVQDFKDSEWYTLRNNLYSSDMSFDIVARTLQTNAPEAGSLASLGIGMIGLWGIVSRGKRRS